MYTRFAVTLLRSLIGASLLLSFSGCERGDAPSTPGEVPSVNQITPDQSMGNGTAGGIVTDNGTAGTSLGALNGGRR